VGRADVDRQHRVQVGVGQVGGGGDRVDAGVVHQDVDPPAQGLGRGGGEGPQVGVAAAEVGGDEDGLPAVGGDRGDDVGPAGGVAAADRDGGALGGEGGGDGGADAAGGAGDEGGAAGQAAGGGGGR
jgi:hypothetical protein